MEKVEQLLCMNEGEGETSYAKNSLIQLEAIIMEKPILEESIREMIQLGNFSNCLRIADFGCSSGPNSLVLISDIIDMVHFACQKLDKKEPTFQVFLNDLPSNDFNTIFRSLPSFYEKLEREKGSDFGPCFVAGMPGSFYRRLFPDNFLHFVHSSYALHWISPIPEELMSESGSPLNKGNIWLAKTSPSRVFEVYGDLFEKDFMSFIRCRSEEMRLGGHMVITMIGSEKKPFSGDINHKYSLLELLGITLHDMVQEELVEEEKVDSLNIPHYAPSPEEVRNVIEKEGSFDIQRLETVKVDWDANMDEANKLSEKEHFSSRGSYVAMTIRVVTQPILVNHFGEEIMDDLFQRYALKMDKFLEVEKGQYTNILVSMKKKIT